VVTGARANRQFLARAVGHLTADAGIRQFLDPEQIAEATARLNQLSRQHFTLRDHAQVLRFFDGLELLEPGVVRVEEWRTPEAETQYRSAMWGGVRRKP
jgi:S-adenosyl methyltransferase